MTLNILFFVTSKTMFVKYFNRQTLTSTPFSVKRMFSGGFSVFMV